MTHIRAGVRLPTVWRAQVYKEPRGEWERHDSGLFQFNKVSLPTDHLACAQPDSAQFGIIVPKFRAPCVDIRKRSAKPLRHLEEHARRIRHWHKKASGRRLLREGWPPPGLQGPEDARGQSYEHPRARRHCRPEPRT